MNILAIDLGAKKTGLAIYREGFVLGGDVTAGWEDWDELIAEINNKTHEHAVSKIVIGLPKSKSGKAEKQYRQFGDKISEQTNIGVDYIDETLTSVAAQNSIDNNKSHYVHDYVGTTRGEDDDEQAAKIILQDYLANKNINS